MLLKATFELLNGDEAEDDGCFEPRELLDEEAE